MSWRDARVLRLAAWLYAQAKVTPATVLLDLAIRVTESARLGPGRPDRVPFSMMHDWHSFDESDLCVPATGPLVVPAVELQRMVL